MSKPFKGVVSVDSTDSVPDWGPYIQPIAPEGTPNVLYIVEMPSEGTPTLHIGDKSVGKAKIKTQPGRFSLAGEGLNLGRDGGEAVTDDYPGSSSWAFAGGKIAKAVVDVSGDPFVDLAEEARMAVARD